MSRRSTRHLVGVATLALIAVALPGQVMAAPTPDRPIGVTADPAGEPAGHGGTTSAGEAGIDHTRFESSAAWRSGSARGVWAMPGPRSGIVMRDPAGTAEYTDPHTGTTSSWEYSTWTSPIVQVDTPATELIASWNAATPDGTWISVESQATYTDGAQSPWYVMGHWARGDSDVKRTSVPGQSDGITSVLTDTVAVDDPEAGALIEGYRLRVTLRRAPGTLASPRIWMVGAMTSTVPDRFEVEPSDGGIAWGTELAVPRRSQNIHSGHYPEYGGGGEVWCSPTSTTMVMEYYGVRPSRRDMSWIEPGYTDPQVAHAARMTWDHAYEGAGNWPLNTAYAASFVGLDAFVTRMSSLDDVERFIAAGIPVITSQSFLESELDGAGYGTTGHLFVVVGFTDDGDVIVNDPASSSNDAVRRVYPREQFEQIWLRTKRHTASGAEASGSGGIAYVIKPFWRPLPEGGDGAW